ncbi:hypothetical protein ARALYDRAFT_327675 [Arabidopsis lyrata subsp. lyrata]|uniref:Pentatricopeptide repeat-containing protein n=1 Tax=Arabidopsis lyrata subsp. lyrata TaxID=81972 RepID=D7M4Z9_ARALL|nr:hypothetical protein ARALYDRAFT_327675 [Arabidopsis lyrata subsp. lyrata]
MEPKLLLSAHKPLFVSCNSPFNEKTNISVKSGLPMSTIRAARSQFMGEGLILGNKYGFWSASRKTRLVVEPVRAAVKRRKELTFDSVVQRDKKLKLVLNIRKILVSQPDRMMSLRGLGKYRRDLGLKKRRRFIALLRKYPGVFEIVEEGAYSLRFKMTSEAERLYLEEMRIRNELEDVLVVKLRKLVMMSIDKRILLEKISHLRTDLGLPLEFRDTICQRYPQYFRVVPTPRGPALELTHWDPELAVSAAELSEDDNRTRESEERNLIIDRPPKFNRVKLPRGLNLSKSETRKISQFRDMRYISPYKDFSHLRSGTLEKEKHACGVIHELLSLTTEKRTLVDHLTHFREEFRFSQQLRGMLIRHPDLFYVSLKGERDSVFLREAYRNSELIDKDPLTLVKEKMRALVSVPRFPRRGGPRKEEEGRDEEMDGSDAEGEEEEETTHARMMKLIDRFELEFISKCLITRYLEFGEFGYASAVFFLGFPRNQVSWRDFLEKAEDFGVEKYKVLEEFVRLQNKGVNFDEVVLAMVFRICAVLMYRFLGFTIHGGLIKRGLDNSDTRVVSALMGFYGRCVSLDLANKIFDEMPKRDDLAWNEIVMVNLQSGNWEKAVKLFRVMRFSGAKAYDSTMVKLLQVCSNKEGFAQGRQIHGYVLRLGFESNVSMCNSLIVMYSRNGKLESSRKVFNSMVDRNLSSWNSIVSSYTRLGYVDDAMGLLDEMETCGLKPDIVTWNSLLSGYASKALSRDAIAVLKRIQIAGLKPNTSSISSLLQAVYEPGLVKLGKAIHGYVIRNQLWYDVYVETTLIDMYIKTGYLPYARMVFDMMDEKNIVAWNSLISGLSYTGLLKEAEALISRMEKEGIKSNAVTWNSLVSGYATWGKTEKALAVVGKMKKNGVEPNVVSWTAILSGCSKNGNFGNGLKIFLKMQEEGVSPNSATISSLLRILGCLSLLYSGKEVHSFCLKNNLTRDAHVATALVDMYAKSGDLQSAAEIFWGIKNKPLASWNCMIMGYAMFRRGEEGIAVFNAMLEAGIEPDAITFTSVLSVCKNSGLVREGWKYFDLMRSHYGVIPTIEHCSCMVELLGRSGYLDEAWDFIRTMPLKPDATIWGAFLSSCKIHRDLELAEIAWKRLQVLEPHNSANYMMMINLYSNLNRWGDVERIRNSMSNNRVRVQDLWSWIQIDQTVHIFYAEGKAHPDEGEIYFELYKLVSEMKKSGYMPDTRCIHQNVSESEKEKLLMGHTEKLAMTYGLIKKKGIAPIRVVKNTNLCSDCHTVAKYISVLRNREIVLQEGARVHHFRDGKCSCNNSW